MKQIHYTVITEQCPNCGHIISQKSDFGLIIVYFMFWYIILPIFFAKIILDRYLLEDPIMPVVGKSIIKCPSCNANIKTNKKELKDFTKVELLNYTFRWLFRLTYFLGGVIVLCLFAILMCLFNMTYSIIYLIYIIIALAIIIAIIVFIYRKKLREIEM